MAEVRLRIIKRRHAMVKKIHIFLLAALMAFGVAQNSQAAMFDVSEIFVQGIQPPPVIPLGPGFPQWYQDFSGPITRPDANLNYGIGPTPGGLKLELCPAGNPLCLSDVVGDEFFWWTADATLNIPASGALTTPGLALLIQATEGTTAAAPIAFNRTRIRIDTPVAGTYTVTFPFGVKVFNAPAGTRGVNDTIDLGCLAAPCDFRSALNTELGPFLFWDTGLPILDPAGVAGDNFFIGDGATAHKVLGSPNGTNFFRIDGPPGSNLGGPGIDFIQTDLFVVSGKVFTAGGTANTAPVAVPDAAATLMATPVDIDVLANDTFTDVPINPGSVAITAPIGGTAAMIVVDGRVKVRFTPTATFTGAGGFSYTVTGFGGVVSNVAAVAVTVEDLKVAKAEFRPKFLKWRISGTSSDTTANSIGIQSGPPTVNATLSGANEVPSPVVSPGSGTASVTVGDAGINFNLNISGLLNITSSHIHLGSAETNGPILFTLVGPNVVSISGTLTAADLNPAAGVTFADAANAILGGNAYVQVHTAVVPSGEVRGQLGPNRLVGSVPVQANGTWVIDGKSPALPDAARTISVRSSNGVQVIDVPLKVK
jgi:hypothetical protein